jgi:hypothetical protein
VECQAVRLKWKADRHWKMHCSVEVRGSEGKSGVGDGQ